MNGYIGLYSRKRSSKRKLVKELIKKKCNVKKCKRTPSIKYHGKLHAGNSLGKAVEGGMHLSVECSYQVPPNETYQECLV